MASNSNVAVTAATSGTAQKVFDAVTDGNDVVLLRLSVPGTAPGPVQFKVAGLHKEFGEMAPGETDVFGLTEGPYGGITEVLAYASAPSEMSVRLLHRKKR